MRFLPDSPYNDDFFELDKFRDFDFPEKMSVAQATIWSIHVISKIYSKDLPLFLFFLFLIFF